MQRINCPLDTSPSGRPGWPTISEESEKWRIEQIRECRIAITSEVPQSDHHRQLKKCYQTSLTEVANKLAAVIGAISAIDRHICENMTTFATTAADLWLQSGSQRFRVLIAVPPTQSSTLVVQPEMSRIGNASGGRLDHEEIVSGCKGQYTDVHSG